MITELVEKRKKQLELQKEIDNKLRSDIDKCPKQIVFLLLQERELNRKLADDFTNFSIFNIFNQVGENLNKYDALYKKMIQFKCSS